jgi:hypothetical protein
VGVAGVVVVAEEAEIAVTAIKPRAANFRVINSANAGLNLFVFLSLLLAEQAVAFF